MTVKCDKTTTLILTKKYIDKKNKKNFCSIKIIIVIFERD